jgi:hypothetical protein
MAPNRILNSNKKSIVPSPQQPNLRYYRKTRRTPAAEDNHVHACRRSTYPLNIASG